MKVDNSIMLNENDRYDDQVANKTIILAGFNTKRL